MSFQIDRWLQDLGIGQYTDAFHQNDVDGRVLPLLTGDDLKELGISLGHRKLILAAIKDLPDELEASSVRAVVAETEDRSETPDTGSVPVQKANVAATAERRHLTVLFADLVRSTELTNRFDPEDMRVLLQSYQDAVAGAVSRYGGYVAKYLGDGLLVFFGWPRAYEDHAVRAIKAGLETVQRVSDQRAPDDTPLSVRVSVASGEVVVGDTIGENTYEEGAMTGPILNLAARIQEHAPPNTVVLPEEGTEASLWRIFELSSLGDFELKGFENPCAILQVDAERSAESRFRASYGNERTGALVGRSSEKGILEHAWQNAQNGRGEVVSLMGEAGMGKSRLTEEFLGGDTVAENADIIRLNCSPYLTSSPFHPVIDRISQDAGVQPDFTDDRILKHVQTKLEEREGLDLRQVLPVFAALVAPSATVAKQVLDMSPQEQRDITVQTLIDTVKLRANVRPVILFVEDAHWIDPSTSALIDRFREICADLPLLILVAHRPEWSLEQSEGYAQVQTLQLRRFDTHDVADLVQDISGQAPDTSLVDQIVEKTDGNPLFVEELTLAIMALGDMNKVNVPSSLKGTLMARLDAVSQNSKQVALAGSVIGREFGRDLLKEAVQGGEGVDMTSCLKELRDSGLIYESGHGKGNYVFRHALIRDAAYQSMLASTRRSQHSRIAQAMVKIRASEIERQPELVARHLTEAGDWAAAYERWRSASEMALARSASREAMTNAKETLDAALHLGDDQSPVVIAAKILVGRSYDSAGRLPESIPVLEEALLAARNIKNAELAADAAIHFSEAAAMAEEWHHKTIGICLSALKDLPERQEIRRCRLMSQLARTYTYTGQREESSSFGRRALELAAKLGDHKAQFSVMMARYGAPFIARNHDEARDWRDNLQAMHEIAEKLGNIDQGRDRALRLFVGAEMADRQLMDHSLDLLKEISTKENHLQLYWVQTHARAMVAILDGDLAHAESCANEAFKIGKQTHGEHVEGVYGVQMFTIRREQSRLHEVAPVIKRLMSESPEDVSWKPGFGLIAAELGYTDAADRILNELAETGFKLPHDAMYSTTLSYLADICAAVENLGHAEVVFDLLKPYEHLTITAGATTVCAGSAARRMGNLSALMGDWESAERLFEAAIDIDTRMKSPLWTAHSKSDFATALLRRGRRADAKSAFHLEAEALATAQELGMLALKSKLEGRAA